MDTQRDPIILVRKRRRRTAFGVAVAAIAVATTAAVSRLEPALPAVDGSALWIRAVQLERLTNVLFVERPALGQENSTIGLFKVAAGGDAERTPVRIGRRSVQFVEVVEGLGEGDRVILSDMSQYDAFTRIRVQ